MIEFKPFKAGHLVYLTPQASQQGEQAALYMSGQAHLLESWTSLSGWVEGRCVGAAGLIPIRPHRATAWAVLSADVGPYMLQVTRKVRRVFRASNFTRIDFTVAEGFEDGARFARMLGAKLETPEPMRAYGADGEDEYMYSIVRG